MKPDFHYISTRNNQLNFSFSDAVLQGLADDGGLFVPEKIPALSAETIRTILDTENIDLTGTLLLSDMIPEFADSVLSDEIHASLDFPIPLVPLHDNIYLLEVFHGPTLAFKDVGARFMARMLSHIAARQKNLIDILVATSGDTGSAVAHGFYHAPGIRVHVLYPAGLVTPLQEKQMATLGDNIFPLKVEGSFDDCQRLVKAALQDRTLQRETGLIFSTANSINIARLLPQMIYHSSGIIQLKQQFGQDNPLLSIPSGNLGNLVAAIYANARGMPVRHFISATNSNTVFPDYLQTGKYQPCASKHTHSSAMDVGHPSNLERLQYFFENDVEKMRSAITGISISDNDTLETIRTIYQQHQYIADPHTAVGIAAARQFRILHPEFARHPVIVTATAHPAKFPDVIEKALGKDIILPVPPALRAVMPRANTSRSIKADYSALHSLLLMDARHP